MKLSPDASVMATLSDKHTISLWNTEGFRQFARFTFPEVVRDYTFIHGSSKIAVLTAGDQPGKPCVTNSKIQIYDTASQMLVVERSLFDVRSIVFLPSSNSIAMGRLARGNSDDQSAYLDFVDLSLSTSGESLPLPRYEMPFNLATLPALNLLVSVGIGLTVWDIPTRTLLQHIHCDNLRVSWDIWETICCCALWQHNQVAIGFDSFDTNTTGYKIGLFDATDWNNPKWFMNDRLYPTSLALSSDGKYLAATLSDGISVRVWDTRNGVLLRAWRAEKMTTVGFSPNSGYLILGDELPQAFSLWKL